MKESNSCTACHLHTTCKSVCLPGQGMENCKLAIFIPHPDMIEDRRGRSMVGQRAEFVEWILKKMGLGMQDVYIDYIVKCYPVKMPKDKGGRMEIVRACRQHLIATVQKLKKLKAVVGLGGISSEVLVGRIAIGETEGTHWPTYEPSLRNVVDHIWIGYDPLYAIESPVESGSIFRIVWQAALEAGLNTDMVRGVPSFPFGK